MTEQEMSLAVFDPFKAIAADIIKKDACQKFDISTPDGEKDLRSWVYRVRGCRSDLEKARVAAKTEALAYGKKVDSMAKELKAPYDKIIIDRMLPLDEIEAKKRADAEAIIEAERVAAEKAEQERLDGIAKQEAEMAKKQAAIKAEENRLAREREILEAEKRAEADAKRREQDAREKAEQDKKDALERAERDKQAAIEAEKEKARKAEADRLAKDDAEKAKKEKQIADEAKRTAGRKHMAKIEKEMWDGLFVIIKDDILTDTVAHYIKIGEIPNVTINY